MTPASRSPGWVLGLLVYGAAWLLFWLAVGLVCLCKSLGRLFR